MLRAITRAVSPSLNRCELSYLERREIDVARAIEQHAGYRRCLAELGCDVITGLRPARAERDRIEC